MLSLLDLEDVILCTVATLEEGNVVENLIH